MDFFRKSEGTWLTLRAVHHFDLVDDESGESNLIVQVVAKDDPKVIEICKQQSIDPAQAMGGGRLCGKLISMMYPQMKTMGRY